MRPLLVLAAAVLALSARAADPEVTMSLAPDTDPRWKDAPPDVALKIDKDTSTLTWTDSKEETPKAHTYRLDVVANHAGPSPFSERLAWLVARNRDDFWILWAYLNETGQSCWINSYHFSENRVRMTLFQGSYVFRPAADLAAAPFADIDIPLEKVPAWKGPKFRHQDFGPEGGKFSKLTYLEGGKWKEREGELIVKPLVELEVPANNGWKKDAWTEIHGLARSADGKQLYYVVTYTAVDHGWVVDLREGRVLYTRFAEPVKLEEKEPK